MIMVLACKLDLTKKHCRCLVYKDV